MPNAETIVIVGAGQAAVQAVDALKRQGFAGRLVVVGEEREAPYQRPPLSKKFLAGELALERLALRPASFYAEARAELRLATRAEALDVVAHELTLDGGERLPYDRLLIATGAVPRRLPVPGSALEGVHVLRTVADVTKIRAGLGAGRRVVVAGGGYIGLEVAATCRGLGLEVDVLEMADRLMNRVVAPPVSAFYAAEHARAGVGIHLGTQVSGFVASAQDPSRVGAVETRDGRRFAADLVIVGVGVAPETALAESAGIELENGIRVDEQCRTSAPDVFAAGDCASHPSLRFARRVRLESVDNAFEQGKTAGANLLGQALVHDKVPWFWSDQFDLKLMIAGLNFDADRLLVRGDPASRSFACCYLRGTELLALDCVNSPKDYLAGKKLIEARAHVDPARLADPTIALKDAAAPP